MRSAAVFLALTLLAGACSPGGDPESNVAGFCDAMTRPLELGSIAMIDIVPNIGIEPRRPTARAVFARNIDKNDREQITQRLDAATELIASVSVLGIAFNADNLGSFAAELETLAAEGILGDIPITFVLEGRVDAKEEFAAFAEELPFLSGIDDIEISTAIDERIFDTGSTTLFELLASSSLSPLAIVFLDPDATEQEIAQVRELIEVTQSRYWWYDKATSFQEALVLLPQMSATANEERIRETLDEQSITPSFRIELATVEAAETLTASLQESNLSGIFDAGSGMPEMTNARHDISRLLLSRAEAASVYSDAWSAAATDLQPMLEELKGFLAVASAPATDLRPAAMAAASTLRDATVEACGITPCLCDRSRGVHRIAADVVRALFQDEQP